MPLSPPDSAPLKANLPPLPVDREGTGLTEYLINGVAVFDKSSGAVENGTALEMPAVDGDQQWAVYAFDPQGNSLDSTAVLLEVDEGGEVWIGLADYSTGRWKLSGPFDGGHTLGLTDDLDYLSPAGLLYVAVIAVGTGDTTVNALSVRTINPNNTPPTAALTIPPGDEAGQMPHNVSFDASGSTDDEGISHYLWDFDGDGGFDALSYVPEQQFVYGIEGAYDAQVSVVDEEGAHSEADVSIQVFAPPGPTAGFSVSARQDILPMELLFVLDASDSLGADYYDWDFESDGIWDVIDGPQIVAHAYSETGTFLATLRVRTDNGSIDFAEQTVYAPGIWSSSTGVPGSPTRESPVVGAQTNEDDWAFPTFGPVVNPVVVGADGTVYVAVFDGTVYALVDDGTATPHIKWSFSIASSIRGEPALGADGTLYFGADNGLVYAIVDNGTSDASAKWIFNAGEACRSAITVGRDGTVYAGAVDGFLYALMDNGTATPTERWSFDANEGILAGATVGPDDTVYIGSFDNNLYALKDGGLTTPEIKWIFMAGDNFLSAPVVGQDGTVYACNIDRKVYALEDNGTITPTLKWSLDTGNDVVGSPAVDSNNVVYVGSTSNTLFALQDNGTSIPTVLWSFDTAGDIETSPAVDADGTVYIGDLTGMFYALQDNGTGSGIALWSQPHFAPINCSATIGPDGKVYVGSDGNLLIAYGD